MALDPAFEKRMKQAESEIEREFYTLDPDEVRREFTRVSDDLLRNARVMDFVPVLVHRHVRENLRVRSLPTVGGPLGEAAAGTESAAASAMPLL